MRQSEEIIAKEATIKLMTDAGKEYVYAEHCNKHYERQANIVSPKLHHPVLIHHIENMQSTFRNPVKDVFDKKKVFNKKT